MSESASSRAVASAEANPSDEISRLQVELAEARAVNERLGVIRKLEADAKELRAGIAEAHALQAEAIMARDRAQQERDEAREDTQTPRDEFDGVGCCPDEDGWLRANAGVVRKPEGFTVDELLDAAEGVGDEVGQRLTRNARTGQDMPGPTGPCPECMGYGYVRTDQQRALRTLGHGPGEDPERSDDGLQGSKVYLSLRPQKQIELSDDEFMAEWKAGRLRVSDAAKPLISDLERSAVGVSQAPQFIEIRDRHYDLENRIADHAELAGGYPCSRPELTQARKDRGVLIEMLNELVAGESLDTEGKTQ